MWYLINVGSVWGQQATGTGIQHFLKNLGDNMLGIYVLITYKIYFIYSF